jgi:hypothetical protein
MIPACAAIAEIRNTLTNRTVRMNVLRDPDLSLRILLQKYIPRFRFEALIFAGHGLFSPRLSAQSSPGFLPAMQRCHGPENSRRKPANHIDHIPLRNGRLLTFVGSYQYGQKEVGSVLPV